ncbi:hypothetical protein UFOVP264_30 [uncultured Caudovirales phage]|uniref:Uncharacterized protein n=1 Tax=uncultured Caudovirales phage TaxID=2100421 RepID=A0A6J5LL08_9CAUD|nr:hypothetical protein UFOVP264_30 [uncultured Caudovirales phage]
MISYTPGQLFIISQFENKCSEYSEMIENPHELVMGVMASKILELYDKIEYLEKRLSYESNQRIKR